MFQGIITALITPFKSGGLDEQAYSRLVEWQIAEGIQGLVPVGTTGESPTLSHEEHERVIALCVEATAKRVPVIAGTGSNNTQEAIALTKKAKALGADAALMVTPYYNKPTAEGLYQHFKAVHDAVELPIILYNIPGRAVVGMDDALLTRLAALPRIVGVKDATGDLARVSTLRAMAGEEFCQLSGEDMTSLAFLAAGGKGCISVSSNIAPKLYRQMMDAWFAGQPVKALELHDQLVALHGVLFCETNPGPVKYAASLMGLCEPSLRLPMVQPSEANQAKIRAVIEGMGLSQKKAA